MLHGTKRLGDSGIYIRGIARGAGMAGAGLVVQSLLREWLFLFFAGGRAQLRQSHSAGSKKSKRLPMQYPSAINAMHQNRAPRAANEIYLRWSMPIMPDM